MVRFENTIELLHSALDFFFPPLCLGCGEYTATKSAICEVCERRFSLFKQPFCLNCMAFYDTFECQTCLDKTTSLLSVASYAPPIKDIIIQFKFKGITSPADYFAGRLVSQFTSQLSELNIDYLIPVPLYPSREKNRGYNQAALFADALSELLSLPVNQDILIRTKKRKPQARLPLSERTKNIHTVFEVLQSDESGKKCLLVDDVVTTGSTVLEAKKILEDNGYTVMAVVSIAHAL